MPEPTDPRYPLGKPTNRPASKAPDKEMWSPVPDKPHLEQDWQGRWRTKKRTDLPPKPS